MSDVRAHWGAAAIGGICLIIGVVITVAFQDHRTDRSLVDEERGSSPEERQSDDEARQLDDLQRRLGQQQALIDKLSRERTPSSAADAIGKQLEASGRDTPTIQADLSDATNNHTAPSEQKRSSHPTAEVDGVVFTLKACHLAHSELRCDLSVTSRDSDRWVEICAPCFGVNSRIIDSNGHQYDAVAAFLGSGYSSGATALLPSDVPMNVGVRFSNLQAAVTHVKLLEIQFALGLRSHHEVRFRDIALR